MNRRAFSLMELLVVIGVIALLAAVAVPAMGPTVRGLKLGNAGQLIADELAAARQAAVSRGVPVEVRFYLLPAHNEPESTPSVFRAVQSFLSHEGTAIPLNKARFLPSPVIISSEPDRIAAESPFLAGTDHPEIEPAEDLANYPKTSYKYRSFYFTPSGRADLVQGKNYLTVVFDNDNPISDGANFFMIQIDPLTGGLKTYRP
jgi:uncharacterized protein (TIGR02596 family)